MIHVLNIYTQYDNEHELAIYFVIRLRITKIFSVFNARLTPFFCNEGTKFFTVPKAEIKRSWWVRPVYTNRGRHRYAI